MFELFTTQDKNKKQLGTIKKPLSQFFTKHKFEKIFLY